MTSAQPPVQERLAADPGGTNSAKPLALDAHVSAEYRMRPCSSSAHSAMLKSLLRVVGLCKSASSYDLGTVKDVSRRHSLDRSQLARSGCTRKACLSSEGGLLLRSHAGPRRSTDMQRCSSGKAARLPCRTALLQINSLSG